MSTEGTPTGRRRWRRRTVTLAAAGAIAAVPAGIAVAQDGTTAPNDTRSAIERIIEQAREAIDPGEGARALQDQAQQQAQQRLPDANQALPDALRAIREAVDASESPAAARALEQLETELERGRNPVEQGDPTAPQGPGDSGDADAFTPGPGVESEDIAVDAFDAAVEAAREGDQTGVQQNLARALGALQQVATEAAAGAAGQGGTVFGAPNQQPGGTEFGAPGQGTGGGASDPNADATGSAEDQALDALQEAARDAQRGDFDRAGRALREALRGATGR